MPHSCLPEGAHDAGWRGLALCSSREDDDAQVQARGGVVTVTMAPPAVSLRALIRELPYRDALRVVALMNNASDRQPRSDSPALAADPEARAIAIDSEEREAAWQALVWDERHDNCGLSAERPRPSCPACGSSALYVRGGLADPGNGDDAGPVRRSPVYLECAGCGAWSWPPREPETTWRLQHALRGGLTPNAAVGRGDVVALAALAFERFPWDQLD